jgi:holo-[acyl-carrier protein] synthase
MEILGHGIDVVDLERFSQLLNHGGSDFLTRCFTQTEQRQSTDRESSNRHESLAGKFAAKEAVAKALGSGFDGTIGPLDIEISNDAAGAPNVILHEAAADLATKLRISYWLLSISHTRPVAIASALAIRRSGSRTHRSRREILLR